MILCSQLAMGDASQLTASVPVEAAKSRKLISGTFTTSQMTTLQSQSAESPGEGLNQNGLYRLAVALNMTDKLNLSMRNGVLVQYRYTDENNDDHSFEDTVFRLKYDFQEVAKSLNLAMGLGSTLPTSKASQRAELNTTSFIDAQLNWEVLPKLEVGIMPRYYQYFHGVEVRSDGKPNDSFGVRIFGDVTYHITDKWEAGTYFWPAKFWTYRGVTHDDYSLGISIGFSILESAKVSLGLGTSANALKDTGRETNYVAFDPQQSTASLNLEIGF